MRRQVHALLATTFLWAVPAVAQTTPSEADAAADSEEIVVFGKGETRQVQELDNKDLTILAAGTSPLKAIEKLPSVNFQSDT